MEIIIRIAYLIIPMAFGIIIYYWSSSFKKMGLMSIGELTEDEAIEGEKVTITEAKGINKFGKIVFMSIGIIVWLLLGLTIGRIASLFAPDNYFKWVIYVLMYFIFLRFPFGIGNRMVKKAYYFENFQEKNIFSILMILGYIIAIYNFDLIPQFLKWHLNYAI